MTCLSEAPPVTVGRLLSSGAAYLSRHGIEADEACTQAEILVSEALGFSGPRLTLERDRIPDEAAVVRLRRDFRRVAGGEPVQYVVGHWPFHNIELRTDARALIPRPETEELVERILKSPQWPDARHIADIGTGTGAIILALAAAAGKERGSEPCVSKHETEGAHTTAVVAKTFTAVDLSLEALTLAKENADALDLRNQVTFVLGNGAAVLSSASCDIIVSNPPYISTVDVDALPDLILEHEPRLALDGGPDGLVLLRQIILDATQALRPGGRFFLEIGDEQGLSVRRLLDRAGYTDVTVTKDFAGHDRYAEGSLP